MTDTTITIGAAHKAAGTTGRTGAATGGGAAGRTGTGRTGAEAGTGTGGAERGVTAADGAVRVRAAEASAAVRTEAAADAVLRGAEAVVHAAAAAAGRGVEAAVGRGVGAAAVHGVGAAAVRSAADAAVRSAADAARPVPYAGGVRVPAVAKVMTRRRRRPGAGQRAGVRPPGRRDGRRPGVAVRQAPAPPPRPTDVFAERLVAVLSGQRPVHWMLRHTAACAYDELARLAEHSPLRACRRPPVVRDIGWFVTEEGALEAFARISADDRIRAMAYRLEQGDDLRWRCTAVEIGAVPLQRPPTPPA